MASILAFTLGLPLVAFLMQAHGMEKAHTLVSCMGAQKTLTGFSRISPVAASILKPLPHQYHHLISPTADPEIVDLRERRVENPHSEIT